jgi:hypothetical protein
MKQKKYCPELNQFHLQNHQSKISQDSQEVVKHDLVQIILYYTNIVRKLKF